GGRDGQERAKAAGAVREETSAERGVRAPRERPTLRFPPDCRASSVVGGVATVARSNRTSWLRADARSLFPLLPTTQVRRATSPPRGELASRRGTRSPRRAPRPANSPRRVSRAARATAPRCRAASRPRLPTPSRTSPPSPTASDSVRY